MAFTARKSANRPVEKRRSARRALKLEAAKVEFGGAQFAATLHQISANGVLVECGAPLTSGDDILIQAFDNQHFRARVIWSKGEQFGCEFDGSVSKAAVSAALLKSAPVVEQSASAQAEGEHSGFKPRLVAIGGFGLLAWAPVAVVARTLLG